MGLKTAKRVWCKKPRHLDRLVISDPKQHVRKGARVRVTRRENELKDVRLEKRGRSAVTHPILHFQTTPSAFDGLSVSIRIGGVHEIFTMVHSQMSEVAPRYVGNVTISAPFVRDDYRTGCDVVPYR